MRLSLETTCLEVSRKIVEKKRKYSLTKSKMYDNLSELSDKIEYLKKLFEN